MGNTPPMPPGSPQTAALTCVELCAGAGGQALGLERAGFRHQMLVEIDPDACATLRTNRPDWRVSTQDVRVLTSDGLAVADGRPDLLAAGVPCPPFSIAGRQLGPDDERDLFPAVLALVAQIRPRAVLIENVKGLLQKRFTGYRAGVDAELASLGYVPRWHLLRACDHGVPQLRPRTVLVALEPEAAERFRWPEAVLAPDRRTTVGHVLLESMSADGWELAERWAAGADGIAPTLCGGSRKHGGPDLGPSRARRAWAAMGVNGSSVADSPPGPGDVLPVRLVPEQLALLQGFPPDWRFAGTKTSRCRQIGNAFPPPVAHAIGGCIAEALSARRACDGRGVTPGRGCGAADVVQGPGRAVGVQDGGAASATGRAAPSACNEPWKSAQEPHH